MSSQTPNTSRIVIYPFLAILFPILSLIPKHHGELFWKEVAIACAGVVAILAALWFILRLLIPNPHARGLILFVSAIAFWTVAPAVDVIRKNFDIREMVSPGMIAFIALGLIGIAVAAITFIRRTNRDFALATRILNILSLSIISVTFAASTYYVLTSEAYTPGNTPALNPVPAKSENNPDIILLIADMYARHDAIQQYFDFDNTPFLEALEARGFYVARDSNANYNFTRSAVPSLLNYQYLDGVTPMYGGKVDPTELIVQNRTAAYLKQRGYDFVAYATGTGLSEIPNADRYLAPPDNLSEFANLLISRTPARFIMNRIHSFKQSTLDSRYYQYDLHRNRILFTFDGLKHFERGPRPQFVFAHVMLPHDPFVFDADLNPIYPQTRYVVAAYPKWENPNAEEYYEGYRNHLQAFNTLALDAIDEIQKNHPDTIILLQGDHGSRYNKIKEYNGEGWEKYVQEEMGILNAYYLPGVDPSKALYPSISSVNSFRVVLNEYFGENLDLLEDHSYFEDWWAETYEDVTDRVGPATTAP